VWLDAGTRLEVLPPSFSPGAAYAIYRSARDQSYDLAIAAIPRLEGVLTKEQRERLSTKTLSYLDPRILRWMKVSTAGLPAASYVW
jgi:hypothetical protein